MPEANAADQVLAPLRRHVLPSLTSEQAARPLFPDYDAAVTWCEAERENLVAAVSLAAAIGRHDLAWKLAVALVTFFHLRKYRVDRLTTLSVALDSAQHVGNQLGEAWSLLSYGGALVDLSRPDEAIAFYQQSLDKWRALGDPHGESQALNNLSEAHLHVGQLHESLEYGMRALALAEEIGNPRETAIRLDSIGVIYSEMERFIEAAAYFERALNASSGMDLHIEGQSLHLLGNALLRLGQLKEAVQRFHQALLIQRQIGDRYGEAETLRSLAHAQRQLNDLNGSRESLRSALSIFQALDDPQAHATQVELEQLARR